MASSLIRPPIASTPATTPSPIVLPTVTTPWATVVPTVTIPSPIALPTVTTPSPTALTPPTMPSPTDFRPPRMSSPRFSCSPLSDPEFLRYRAAALLRVARLRARRPGVRGLGGRRGLRIISVGIEAKRVLHPGVHFRVRHHYTRILICLAAWIPWGELVRRRSPALRPYSLPTPLRNFNRNESVAAIFILVGFYSLHRRPRSGHTRSTMPRCST